MLHWCQKCLRTLTRLNLEQIIVHRVLYFKQNGDAADDGNAAEENQSWPRTNGDQNGRQIRNDGGQ
jgi:hypothetical protein